MFNVYLTARIWRLPGGLGRPNCSGLLLPAEPSFPGQTVPNLFGTLFVVIDALLLASFRSSFFDDVFHVLSGALGVDFELPSRPSDPQKP